MKKIILIIVYFGKLPNFFKIWLKSVEKNSDVDFLIVTDDHTEYNYPKNVKIKYDTFKNIQSLFNSIFDFNNVLNQPYKLCEYKPFYNLIFNDEVANYDFWGYCDLDLIFGNIRKFVTDEVLDAYDKIYTRGHMTLFRNNKEVNDLIQDKKIRCNCYNYYEALTTDYVCHFDEGYGVSEIFKSENGKQYEKVDCSDINQKKFYFENLFRDDLSNRRGIYYWNDGSLYFIDNYCNATEVIYAHFQKRIMNFDDNVLDEYKFYIIPNSVVSTVDLNKIGKYCKGKLFYTDYVKIRLKEIKTNLKNGAIIEKIYRQIKKYKFWRFK